MAILFLLSAWMACITAKTYLAAETLMPILEWLEKILPAAIILLLTYNLYVILFQRYHYEETETASLREIGNGRYYVPDEFGNYTVICAGENGEEDYSCTVPSCCTQIAEGPPALKILWSRARPTRFWRCIAAVPLHDDVTGYIISVPGAVLTDPSTTVKSVSLKEE